MEELKYHYKYPYPSVTTDCVIFGFDGTKLKVLLVERGIDPYKGHWAFPGGAYYHDSIEDARLTYNAVMRIAKKWMGDDQAFVKLLLHLL